MNNYYIDYVPSDKFLNNLYNLVLNNKLSPENIVLNLYTSELPSNNVNSLLYKGFSFYSSLLPEVKKLGYKFNIIFDASCLGNVEFSENADNLLSSLDNYIALNPDYITITNNFCFNYIKNRYPDVNVILSEYLNINNIQKINRYLGLGCCGVKINVSLVSDIEQMSYIAKYYDKNQIHININRNDLKEDIFFDPLNYRTAHFIQKGEYSYAKEAVKEIYSTHESSGNILSLKNSQIKEIMDLGFTNFWIYCNSNDESEYLETIGNMFAGHYEKMIMYPYKR